MKTIFIHGGSRGSLFINSLVKKIAPRLLTSFRIHHQTGEMDYPNLVDFKESLPADMRANYRIDSYLVGKAWVTGLRTAHLVIGRAGANVCSELLILKKPAILIPLKYSYLNEQYENARFLQKIGGVEIIEQKNVTNELLYQTILKVSANIAQYQKAYEKYVNPDLEATDKLLSLILKVVQK